MLGSGQMALTADFMLTIPRMQLTFLYFCVTISVVDLTKKGTFRKEVINSIQPDGKMSEMAETSATTAGGPPFLFLFGEPGRARVLRRPHPNTGSLIRQR